MENRVVTEAMLPMRTIRDLTFAATLGNLHLSAWDGNGNGTTKARGSLARRNIGHTLQEKMVAVNIAGSRPPITRRLDARLTS